MAVATLTLLPLLSLLPCAHLLVSCKKRKERMIGKEGQKETKRKKIAIRVF
jgi:hypothetical protein